MDQSREIIRAQMENLLSDLLVQKSAKDRTETLFTSVTDNHANAIPGSVFICVRGSKHDGHTYIRDAIKKGASCVIVEDKRFVADIDVGWYLVSSTRKAIAKLCGWLYEFPSDELTLIGVTGTNGKSSTAIVLKSILEASGNKCGVIGTIFNYDGRRYYKPSLTTPSSLEINQLLYKAKVNRCKYVVMEVSSHSLEQERVAYLRFGGAIYTNLSRDHLDYHSDMYSYARSKSMLFAMLTDDSVKIINCDDDYHSIMTNACKPRPLTHSMQAVNGSNGHDVNMRLHDKERGKTDSIVYYGLNTNKYYFKTLSGSIDFQRLFLNLDADTVTVTSYLIGKHNAYNILAAAAMALRLGCNTDAIRRGIESIKFIPGRLEPVYFGQDYKIFVDYAHTPSALEKVVESLKSLHGPSKSKIILIFGCGGDRDKGKRPMMGKIACRMADYSIITSDNPRTESPSAILNDIVKGFNSSNFEVEGDRKEAIKRGLSIAGSGDIVLIAGKGHEDYQILGSDIIYFDDRDICRQILKEMIVKDVCP